MKRDTGLTDKEYRPILEGDTVSFCGHTGKIVFECGAFGVAVEDTIDYYALQDFMDKHGHICCGNEWNSCYNDNFISLWELGWNFNCFIDDNDALWMLEVVQ